MLYSTLKGVRIHSGSQVEVDLSTQDEPSNKDLRGNRTIIEKGFWLLQLKLPYNTMVNLNFSTRISTQSAFIILKFNGLASI